MSTFKLKKEMLADFPELAEQMREMNINRVSYVGLTFFFFLMLNLVNNPMSQGRSIVIGTAMVTFLSLTYSISAFVFRKSILSSARYCQDLLPFILGLDDVGNDPPFWYTI